MTFASAEHGRDLSQSIARTAERAVNNLTNWSNYDIRARPRAHGGVHQMHL
jgi:hypothetical protein